MFYDLLKVEPEYTFNNLLKLLTILVLQEENIGYKITGKIKTAN
jgi:hypothetical protein